MSVPRQAPLGSGFGARSTAADVVAGVDLTGKVAVVTGGYSGLGLEITRALAGAGARVIVPARRPGVASAALAGVPSAEVMAMDLADLASVARAAGEMLIRETAIDMVIANAGIMACPETRVGPGWEAQFATNHLGHFAFVNRLWPLLTARGARVVSVSSGAHGITGIRWDDMHFSKDYDPWQAYGQSKTANVLFAVELNRRGAAHGVQAFSLHPGAILTPLQRHLSREFMVGAGWVDEQGRGSDPSFKTVEQGAATAVWAATSPLLDDRGGEYLMDCDVAPADDVKDWASDPREAVRLWDYSSEAIHVA